MGLLFAAVRLVWLGVTTIIALSRLDACLFTMYKGKDRGYASFLAMALMLHSFQVPRPVHPALFTVYRCLLWVCLSWLPSGVSSAWRTKCDGRHLGRQFHR